MARTYGTTASRGYGTTHQKIRARWKPLVESGQVQCHAITCLEERDGRSRWIPAGAPWHLGHTEDRSGWTGPEHLRCGCSDGARRGNKNRDQFILAATPHGPTCKVCGVKYHYTGRQCMICGRHYHPSRGVQYTCSRPCGVAYRRLGGYGANPLPACEICGKPCASKGARTCSDACLHKRRDGQRKELTCEKCGQKFTGVSAKYCSPNCQSLAYYYANREERIAKVLARYYERKRATATASE